MSKIKKILLIGGKGTLGTSIIKSKIFKNLDAPQKKDLNILDRASIRKHLKKKYYLIINCAAKARMKECEKNPLDAIKVNEEYPMVITRGEEPMEGNSMVFDLIAQHGQIDQGRTSFKDSFFQGEEVFRDDPNVFHLEKSNQAQYLSLD